MTETKNSIQNKLFSSNNYLKTFTNYLNYIKMNTVISPFIEDEIIK